MGLTPSLPEELSFPRIPPSENPPVLFDAQETVIQLQWDAIKKPYTFDLIEECNKYGHQVSYPDIFEHGNTLLITWKIYSEKENGVVEKQKQIKEVNREVVNSFDEYYQKVYDLKKFNLTIIPVDNEAMVYVPGEEMDWRGLEDEGGFDPLRCCLGCCSRGGKSNPEFGPPVPVERTTTALTAVVNTPLEDMELSNYSETATFTSERKGEEPSLPPSDASTVSNDRRIDENYESDTSLTSIRSASSTLPMVPGTPPSQGNTGSDQTNGTVETNGETEKNDVLILYDADPGPPQSRTTKPSRGSALMKQLSETIAQDISNELEAISFTNGDI